MELSSGEFLKKFELEFVFIFKSTLHFFKDPVTQEEQTTFIKKYASIATPEDTTNI